MLLPLILMLIYDNLILLMLDLIAFLMFCANVDAHNNATCSDVNNDHMLWLILLMLTVLLLMLLVLHILLV